MTQAPLDWVGRPVDSIDTPALVVDLDAMDRNITRMARFAQTRHIQWRPHAKMHKSAELAQLLVQAGAVGCCVQKTSEAVALAEAGALDIFITNEVISAQKLARVASLALRLKRLGGRLAIAVDSALGVQRLALALGAVGAAHATIDVFVEIDCGHGRCGVSSPAAAVELAQLVTAQHTMRWAGLQAYHGQAQHLHSVTERQATVQAAARHVLDVVHALDEVGIAVPLVTGGGTGTMGYDAASGIWGELQAGSFLFMDAHYASLEREGVQPGFEHALFVRTQVMSRSAEHAVCDAGHKSHAVDSGMPTVYAHGLHPPWEYASGGDEHGILRVREPGAKLPELGECLWLVPGHCDPTINLHNQMLGVRGGLLAGSVERVIRVDARGALT